MWPRESAANLPDDAQKEHHAPAGAREETWRDGLSARQGLWITNLKNGSWI
jgi:hypothetical protein